MFQDNVDINKNIYKLVKELCTSYYSGGLKDYNTINNIDRELEAENFINNYIIKNSASAIGGNENRQEFKEYVALEIDRLIPLFCFLELNRDLSHHYNRILTRRIFLTYGKNEFDFTKDLVYKYKHNFKKEKEYIKNTLITEKQLKYLKQLAMEQGFLVDNEDFLSKAYAQLLIKYLKGESDEEPNIFGFFIVCG